MKFFEESFANHHLRQHSKACSLALGTSGSGSQAPSIGGSVGSLGPGSFGTAVELHLAAVSASNPMSAAGRSAGAGGEYETCYETPNGAPPALPPLGEGAARIFVARKLVYQFP